jgi:hypothetical protein
VPQSIPPGLKTDHVLKALADLDGGVTHAFGEPTKYELVHDGKRYAPKAVIGLAYRYLSGRVLQPDEFSGGEAPGQANYVLRRLGFTVVRKGEPVEHEEPEQAGKDWTEAEVALAVTDYFTMLRAELLGQSYSKTEHRNALRPQLSGRSDGASSSSTPISVPSCSAWACRTSTVTNPAATTRASSPRLWRPSWTTTPGIWRSLPRPP